MLLSSMLIWNTGVYMELLFERPPDRPWLRLMLSRRRGVEPGGTLPGLRAEWSNVLPGDLAAYQGICGFPEGDGLPLPYPQVLATPLHLQLLAHPLFPFSSIGLVHVSQSIERFRPIASDEPLLLRCWADGLRQVRRGMEFDLHTEALSAGERVWLGRATIFTRTGKGHGQKKPRPEELPLVPLTEESWEIPENLGRRYTKISGDFNPIHIHALLAKPFGFSRAIIHGMWSLARCIASLPEPVDRIEAGFQRPVYLPSTVRYVSARTGEGRLRAELHDPESGKRHLWVESR
jgi:acyl dehydratase